jgi:GDP-L-fucose synthase
MQNYSDAPHINVGTGQEISILDLAQLIGEIVGYPGKIIFDASKPDGMMRKVMNVDRLSRLGWTAKTQVRDGFRAAYDWYVANIDQVRRGHGS